jgi:hypothetical protein
MLYRKPLSAFIEVANPAFDARPMRAPPTKEDVMPAVEAVIVAAIVTAFVIFAKEAKALLEELA